MAGPFAPLAGAVGAAKVETVGPPKPPFADDDIWELYDGSSDWTQARDLSTERPDKLHELQRLFTIEAARYNVLPLDDRSFERVLPEISGKPELIAGNKQLLLPGMFGLTEQHSTPPCTASSTAADRQRGGHGLDQRLGLVAC